MAMILISNVFNQPVFRLLCILILASILSSCSGKVNDSSSNTCETPEWEEAAAEANAQFDETLALAADMNEDDGLTIGNPWRKGYFKNEWGEEIYDSPFIYTIINGSGWNICIRYESAQSTQTADGVFGLYIMDDHGKTTMYEPVVILVRGSDGETRSVPVTEVDNGVAYIADPGVVEGFKTCLNSGQFDIRMEFDKYNERHAAQARWESAPGSHQEAITKLL